VIISYIFRELVPRKRLKDMLIISYLDINIKISTSIIKQLVQCECLSIMIHKKYYLKSLYLITIFIKTKQHMIVFQMMMILKMAKNI
jgi:hypothetical protein